MISFGIVTGSGTFVACLERFGEQYNFNIKVNGSGQECPLHTSYFAKK